MLTSMPQQEWVFRARLQRVIDGDTIDVEIDCGMHNVRTERLRLLRVNAPEMHGESHERGQKAKEFTERWLVLAITPTVGEWPLVIQTYKDDNFGRYLAEVWRVYDKHSLNDDLLSTGNAVPFTAAKH